MGTIEDEFAAAEALFQSLTEKEAIAPAPIKIGKIIVEEKKEIEFIVGNVYSVSVNLISFISGLSIKSPILNSDIIPLKINGNVPSARSFCLGATARIYFKILEISGENCVISIGNPGLKEKYLEPITENGIMPFIIKFNKNQIKTHDLKEINTFEEKPNCIFIENVDRKVIKAAYEQAIKEKEEKERKEDKFLQSLDQIALISEEIFPENAYLTKNINDFKSRHSRDNISSVYNDEHFLIIRFPEITITNSNSESHVIRDLFVVIGFYRSTSPGGVNSIKMRSSLYGCRTTVTSAEYRSGYMHSHLPCGGSFGDLEAFCLGGSSSMAISVADLHHSFNMDKFELLLYQIGAYVRHESIEGGPYIRMEKIGVDSYSSSNAPNTKRDFDLYLNLIKNNSKPLPLTATTDQNDLYLEFNEKNEEFLLMLGEATQTPCVKNQQGLLVPYSTANTFLSDRDKASVVRCGLIFKGEEVFLKVDDVEKENKIKPTKYPSPASINFIKNTIEKEINLKTILKEKYEFSR